MSPALSATLPAGMKPGPINGQAERRQRAHAMARGRMLWLLIALSLAFALLAGQLLRLGMIRSPESAGLRAAMNTPVSRTYARPDIVDRHGRLLATDLVGHSLYADPNSVLDTDRAVEALLDLFPDIDPGALRRRLSDPDSRFEWIRRGLTPGLAQQAHDLGLPGFALRKEPKRTYPLGRLAGHVLGVVSIDNKGLSGIERYVDREIGIETAITGEAGSRHRLRLTIDVGVQHGLEEELAGALARYNAKAAAGVVLDVDTGEIAAISSLPDVDPAHVVESQDPERIDRMSVGQFELGSVFKAFTLALALEDGGMKLDHGIDVQGPLAVAGHKINDLHPAGASLPLSLVFLRSSNVGFGRIALQLGADRLQEFYRRLGLTAKLHTEAGPVTSPRLPRRWGEAEIATAGFGHGLAVTPLQFAVATAALINGGRRITPRFVVDDTARSAGQEQIISPSTSAQVRELFRANVVGPVGTGRRAYAAGYEVGGKTGTAEQPGVGGYRRKSVISSFVAAFPMSKPRFLTYVLLFEPQGNSGSDGHITAGHNAAPLTARLVQRIAPLLGVAPTAGRL